MRNTRAVLRVLSLNRNQSAAARDTVEMADRQKAWSMAEREEGPEFGRDRVEDSGAGVEAKPAAAESPEPGHRRPAPSSRSHGAEAKAAGSGARQKFDRAGRGLLGGRTRVVVGAGLIVATLAVGFAVRYWTFSRYMISTDDAYIRADVTNIATKVAGYVTKFDVKDNAAVQEGDVIAVIDDGDYKIARDAAAAKADTQRATIARLDSQVTAQDSVINQARATLIAAEADARRAVLDYSRYAQLAKSQYGTQQRFEQAEADRNRTAAQVASAKAQQANAEAGKVVLAAQKLEAERTLVELNTQLEKAERDLAFTKIRAPVAGSFGNKSVQVGAWVNSGTRLGALVASDSLYVEANFKETQLQRMRAGQPVAVSVDALPDRTISGTLDSLSPGSGALFSLLPPENATGNFTKIVQRVPVRIALPNNAETLALLRPGLSVYAVVDTRRLQPAQPSNGAPGHPVAQSNAR